jgi:predicted permease
MMNKNAIPNPNWSWHRIWVKRRGGASVDLVRDRVAAFIRAHRQERTTEWKNAPASKKSEYINATIRLTPAAAGVSQLQREYGRAIWILAVLAVLLLLIACANVANLMLAQAAARSREMALRVSIGAGAGRLIQLVMMESVLLALAAAALGGLLAWWMAPFLVAQISGADNPVELFLAMDWRVVGFAALLSVVVVCLFGLPTALRAGAVHPMSALRAGTDSRGKRRLMHVLVAAQVALCLLVHLVAGLFLATYDRLSNVPLGFVSDRVLTASFSSKEALPPERWEQLRTILAELPGVEQAAMSSWPLLSGNSMLRGVKVEGGSQDEGGGSPYALGISPGFLATMRMKLLDGRDFRPEESLGAVAIVNESFARRYFPNVNPIGRTFQDPNDERNRTTRIVGLVNDARYDRLRNDFRATVYTPLRELDAKGVPQGEAWASYSIRTKLQDPLAMAPLLRAAATRVAGDIRVGDIETQQEIIDRQLVRERLVAALSFFFAAVALLLAAVGLYGVLHFSVLQRRREIGIRMALGAPGSKVAWSVARDICLMLLAGSGVGLALGMASERYLTTLLFQVKPSEWQLIAAPLALILVAAVMAALAPIARAVRIDPAQVLRAE